MGDTVCSRLLVQSTAHFDMLEVLCVCYKKKKKR